MSPVWAQVGSPYALSSFKPYLERGYNTRLAWQGWPVELSDPHLYLHDAQSLALEAEVEFGVVQGQIQTQIIKVYQPATELSLRNRQELVWFALEATQRQFSEPDLERLLEKKCFREWRLSDLKASPLFVTLYSDREASYLRFSSQGSSQAPPLSLCH